jgi:hypothetical protein
MAPTTKCQRWPLSRRAIELPNSGEEARGAVQLAHKIALVGIRGA